jgi:hypothetical protein
MGRDATAPRQRFAGSLAAAAALHGLGKVGFGRGSRSPYSVLNGCDN